MISLGKQEVESTVDILKDKEEKRTIEVDTFETDPVYVRDSFSRTLNLGDFNSLSSEVGLAVPCYREELDEVSEFTEQWAKNKLSNIIDKIKSKINSEEK